MVETEAAQEAGVTLAARGRDVLMTVGGVSAGEGRVEVLVSAADARRLALRLLQVVSDAEEQQRRLERMFRRRVVSPKSP
jgi:hypothetical protein